VWKGKGKDYPKHINANANVMKVNTKGKSRSESKLKARATIFRERLEGSKLRQEEEHRRASGGGKEGEQSKNGWGREITKLKPKLKTTRPQFEGEIKNMIMKR